MNNCMLFDLHFLTPLKIKMKAKNNIQVFATQVKILLEFSFFFFSLRNEPETLTESDDSFTVLRHNYVILNNAGHFRIHYVDCWHIYCRQELLFSSSAFSLRLLDNLAMTVIFWEHNKKNT